jgi:hypothetical protein
MSFSKSFLKAMENYIKIHQKIRNPLIALYVCNITFWSANNKTFQEDNLRFNEKETVSFVLNPFKYQLRDQLITSNLTFRV